MSKDKPLLPFDEWPQAALNEIMAPQKVTLHTESPKEQAVSTSSFSTDSPHQWTSATVAEHHEG